MPKKRVIQATGSKEAPLAIVGISNLVQQSPEEQVKVYTPEDVEHQYYQDLLQDYFEKFTSWQKIFMDEQYYHSSLRKDEQDMGFRISQTPQGLILCTSEQYEYHYYADPSQARQDTVMYANMSYTHSPPNKEGKYGMTVIYMSFNKGAAGEQLFVDPNGKPLRSVHIDIGSYWSDTWREVLITASYPKPFMYSSKSELEPTLDIKFKLRDGTLNVSKVYPKIKNTVLMPINYATSLLNTIDRLISVTTTTIPQPERRASPEQATPKKLLAPQRRKPPR